MNSKIKYWLIYAYEDMRELGRQTKPFNDKDVMDRWIKRNRSSIIVISKTQVMEG